MKASILCAIIDARYEKGISQKQLEHLSGVSQPVIARLETDVSDPQLTTILKILQPLGKTLAVVDL
ncbi:MAG TPA: helix-turn-helix transcriptional regulator [Clostridia bacterium]